MSPTDRADELRAMPDLWPEIHMRLWVACDQATETVRHYALDYDDYTNTTMTLALESKFRAGEAEHGRDWLNMTRDELREEIRNEIRDLVLYHAMILARWDEDESLVAVMPV